MSTTIDVIPVLTLQITFGEVLAKATDRIHDRLASLGIHERIDLRVNVHKNDESIVREVMHDTPFLWGKDEYAWFSIAGIPGGTDAHMVDLDHSGIDPSDPWWYLRQIAENNHSVTDLASKLERAKNIGKLLYFRRSAGQTGVIALCYGLIAASVAELTGGILWSDDGAWSVKAFPAEHLGFFEWYFVPERALDADERDWAERCLSGIREDLFAAKTSIEQPDKHSRLASWFRFRP